MENNFRQSGIERLNQLKEIGLHLFVVFAFGDTPEIIQARQAVIIQNFKGLLIHGIAFRFVKCRHFRIGQVNGICRNLILFGHFQENL